MKRHPSLQPLSPHHLEALLQVQMLRSAADGSPDDRRVARERFRDLWERWFRDHLDLEERRLPPLIPGVSDVDRIREERQLFTAIEQATGEAELRSLGMETRIVEAGRPRSCRPKR